jgi:Flp pilus assembly protein TadG
MTITRFRNCRGVVAVEAALIFSFILFPLIFGIIEFSLLLYNKQVITNASREGARAGIVIQSPRLTDGEIEGIVLTYCGNHLITFGVVDDPQINISPAYGTRQTATFGDDLTVTVTYDYDFLVLPNFLEGFVGDINLTATTLMKME